MGVSLNDSIDKVCKKLMDKGFQLTPLFGRMKEVPFETLFMSKWDINNSDTAHIIVSRLEDSQLVHSIEVAVKFKTENAMDANYTNYQQILKDRYGEGKNKIDETTHKKHYTYGIKNTNGKYIGTISLAKTQNNVLRIYYKDSINSELNAAEIEKKEAETKIRLEEERQKRIAQIASDGKCHFIVNPDGTFSTIDDKPYYVIAKSKKTAHQIYTELKTNASKIFVNPSKVLSGVENQILVINGMARDFYKTEPTKDNIVIKYSMLYRIEMQVKDGRLRVNTPSIDYFTLDWTERGYETLRYETQYPKECLPLMFGASDFTAIIDSIVNETANDIVFGIQTTNDDDW